MCGGGNAPIAGRAPHVAAGMDGIDWTWAAWVASKALQLDPLVPARGGRVVFARLSRSIGLVCLALSCGGAAEDVSDRADYLRILKDSTTSGATLLKQCLQLTDPDLRGDCSLVVATRSATIHNVQDWCGRVEPGLWQSECMFHAAESAAMRQAFERARYHCANAGPFRVQCDLHTFQLLVASQAHIAGDLAAAERHHAALLKEWSIFRAPGAMERMWSDWFAQVMVAKGFVGGNPCAVVSPAHRESCRAAAVRAGNQLRRTR